MLQQPSTFAIAREVVRKDGLGMRGLNKGLTATLGRHGVWNMVYFSFYHNVKSLVPAAKVSVMLKAIIFVFRHFTFESLVDEAGERAPFAPDGKLNFDI